MVSVSITIRNFKNSMKKIFFLAFSIAFGHAFAQPVINNGNNVPAPGTTIPLSMATPSAIGSAGASQAWDFSALTYTVLGTGSVITPSTAPMGSSFPTSNYAYNFGSTYSFFSVSSTKMEAQAYSIVSAGSGNDMSPNARTVLQFPFNYQDVVSDTWQKVGGSVNNVTLTYDGYGTLIMPSITYSNVVRVKEDYGGGAIDYQWYMLNPLMSILVYDHNNNTLYYSAATPLGMKAESEKIFSLYPDLSAGVFTVQIKPGFLAGKCKIIVTNTLGEKVQEQALSQQTTQVILSSYSRGIYYCTVELDGRSETQKIVLE
jgi:hypothetical protein